MSLYLLSVQSKYIGRLVAKAKEREKEQDILYERKLSKERQKEDHLYGDKDKCVTRAYKEKLAEEAKWLAEEKRQDAKEEANDVRIAILRFVTHSYKDTLA